jgi:hypothetical protein
MYSIKDKENLIIGCHRVDVPLIGIEKKESGLGFYLALVVHCPRPNSFQLLDILLQRLSLRPGQEVGVQQLFCLPPTTSREPPNLHHHHILLLLEALLLFPF